MQDFSGELPRPTLKQKFTLLAVFIIPHIALVYALLFELSSPHIKLGLCLLAIMYLASGFGIEAGFHRLLSHRAYQSPRFVQAALVILGSMAAQGPVLAWAANHRRHHRYTDIPGDPHSPEQGFLHAHFGWFITVGQSSAVRFAPDLLTDPLLRRLNQQYWFWVAAGILIPAIAGYAVTQSWDGLVAGLVWGGLVRVCLTYHALGSINSICHRWGQRPYEVQGNSVNNFWLALPTMGQSWHNNHHAYPNAVSTSFRWWQIDISGTLLRGLRFLKLVQY